MTADEEEWTREELGAREVVWTRADGHATVRLRRTATGEWAVTLDRLRQAPGGEAYRHETVEGRAAAERLAEEWRRGDG